MGKHTFEFYTPLLLAESTSSPTPNTRLRPSSHQPTSEALSLSLSLHEQLGGVLCSLHEQRQEDHHFIDQRTQWANDRNTVLASSAPSSSSFSFSSSSYFPSSTSSAVLHHSDPRFTSVIGEVDKKGRVVFGPKRGCGTLSEVEEGFLGKKGEGKEWVAPLPAHFAGLKEGCVLVSNNNNNNTQELHPHVWGELSLVGKGGVTLPLTPLPPIFAPSSTLLSPSSPFPAHLLSFAEAIKDGKYYFYVGGLETEEEAAYLKHLFQAGEKQLGLKEGTLRLFLIVTSPRLLLRLTEVVEALSPCLFGASLCYDSYLSSSSLLFKHDPYSLFPSKFEGGEGAKRRVEGGEEEVMSVVGGVVGGRGGVVVAPLFSGSSSSVEFLKHCASFAPSSSSPSPSPSPLVLVDGYWVSDASLVSLSLSLVQQQKGEGEEGFLGGCRREVRNNEEYNTVWEWKREVEGRRERREKEKRDRRERGESGLGYVHGLVGSDFVGGCLSLEEVRTNIFVSLQIITSLLQNNTFPSLLNTTTDLSNIERMRWEIWREIHHSRLSFSLFLRLLHEESRFLRLFPSSSPLLPLPPTSPPSPSTKRPSLPYTPEFARWLPVASFVLLSLVLPPASPYTPSTDRFVPTKKSPGIPVDSFTDYYLMFQLQRIRHAEDPWAASVEAGREVERELEKERVRIGEETGRPRQVGILEEGEGERGLFEVREDVRVWGGAFGGCGCERFAEWVSGLGVAGDEKAVRECVMGFSEEEVVEAAGFHGTLGSAAVSALDKEAKGEQATLQKGGERQARRLFDLGEEYRKKFGFKFLAFAEGNTAEQLYDLCSKRMQNSKEIELQNAKEALFSIARKRMMANGFLPSPSSPSLEDKMKGLLKELKVPGVSLSVFNHTKTDLPSEPHNVFPGVQSFGAGYASVAPERKMCENGSTWFELCSISKTFAAAFAIELLSKKGVSLDDPVNKLLADTSILAAPSDWRLKSAEGCPAEWADEVLLRHLVDHTALGMHYVFGIPLSRKEGFPAVRELLDGEHDKEFQYPSIVVAKKPGLVFKYSGGGFLVLQHLMMCVTGHADVGKMTLPFFAELGIEHEVTFDQKPTFVSEDVIATGYLDGDDNNQSHSGHFNNKRAASDGETRMMFPPFPAGSLGTTRATARFLQHLIAAYHNIEGSGPISHTTAGLMLGSYNMRLRSTEAFMCPGSCMGLGVFTARIGENWLAIHQASNDGFRALYVACFRGPNAHSGFVVAANGSNKGVILNSLVSGMVAQLLDWKFVDYSQLSRLADSFASAFSAQGISQEQIVNLGYKSLLFDAFQPDDAELTPIRGPYDPLTVYDIMQGAKVETGLVTDQFFSCARNLICDRVPNFDPKAFGIKGKIMDSWEPQRHNQAERDTALFRLSSPCNGCQFVWVSTMWHDGNQADAVRVEGVIEDPKTKELKFFDLVPRSALKAHSIHRYAIPESLSSIAFQLVRISSYPDGGVSRVRLFSSSPSAGGGSKGALPEEERKLFFLSGASAGTKIDVEIPPVIKDIQELPAASPSQISQNYKFLAKNFLKTQQEGRLVEVDIACNEFGGRVVEVSNQHYGPASSILSPMKPQGMFDGFETSRAREGRTVIPPLGGKNVGGHWAEVAFGRPACIHRIEMDFSYFIGNNPMSVTMEGFDGKEWIKIVPKTETKPFLSNSIEIVLPHHLSKMRLQAARIVTFPCGGFNRVHFYTYATPSLVLNSNI